MVFYNVWLWTMSNGINLLLWYSRIFTALKSLCVLPVNESINEWMSKSSVTGSFLMFDGYVFVENLACFISSLDLSMIQMLAGYNYLNILINTAGLEFEQAPGVGDRQGSLVCCSPWGCKESEMTEQLNWTDWLQSSLSQNWICHLPSLCHVLPTKTLFYWIAMFIQSLVFADHTSHPVFGTYVLLHSSFYFLLHQFIQAPSKYL